MSRTLAALGIVLTLLAGCTSETTGVADEPQATGRFVPNEGNQDPSEAIEGIEIAEVEYKGGLHADPGQRVAYDKHPPLGGAHDQVWASCNGVVYDQAVRTEHMVHSLEHSAVWIAYNPDQLDEQGVSALAEKVEGQPYLMLSPYPGIDSPIAMQSWNHQLKVDDAGDERIDQFIQALRANEYTTPEPGAPCDIDAEAFDPTNPPPFDPSPPGADAMPVNGE
jgi:Protein of unknown function (DUF3105)